MPAKPGRRIDVFPEDGKRLQQTSSILIYEVPSVWLVKGGSHRTGQRVRGGFPVWTAGSRPPNGPGPGHAAKAWKPLAEDGPMSIGSEIDDREHVRHAAAKSCSKVHGSDWQLRQVCLRNTPYMYLGSGQRPTALTWGKA